MLMDFDKHIGLTGDKLNLYKIRARYSIAEG